MRLDSLSSLFRHDVTESSPYYGLSFMLLPAPMSQLMEAT